MNMMQKDANDREKEFDYLRTFAAVGVMVIHVCAMQWGKIDIYSSRWICLHIYDMLVRVSVPIFFMISGRFFLDPSRNVSLSKLRNKRCRIVVAFIFWSAVYMLLNMCRVVGEGGSLKENFNWIVVEFFSGEYHMWFLYALWGLYLITPLLRKIVESRRLTEYFLVLFFIFGLVWPMAEQLPKLGVLFVSVGTEMLFRMTTGYVGYYVLGYYLYKYPLSKIKTKILYILGMASAVFSVAATLCVSWKTGIAYKDMAEYLTPNVAFAASALYVATLCYFKDKRLKKSVMIVSKYSFGCYLAHPLFLWIFEWIGFVPSAFCTVISVPVITASALILSLLLTLILDKIPYLRRVV